MASFRLLPTLLISLLSANVCRAEAPSDAAGLFSRRWACVSETSAVIYWQLGDIREDGTSFVEYGLTTDYGEKTQETAVARWSHFHRLTGLKADTTYHYRMVLSVDGKPHRSEDLTLTTRTYDNAIRVPGRIAGPPYVLDKGGATYVLTEDIVADATAVLIEANDVTFDLNGHTITFGDDTDKQVFGVQFANKGMATVKNGHIAQGKRSGKYSACVESRWRPFPAEVCGISTDVHLPCSYPARFFGATAGAHVHHNHLYSRVTEIESRHYPGNDLLRMDNIGEGVRVHDNLLTEGCHIGIRVGGGKNSTGEGPAIHHNDIKHHQRYVNGYAFAVSRPGADIHHNKVTSIGRSVHLTAPGIRFHDNYLDTCGHMTLDDLPAKSRPWKKHRVELHGIKFEGKNARECKVYGNFMRITQKKPDKEWDYVPATPLNIACYDPNAMNEVYRNTFIALTEYEKTHHGGYGASGQWASAVYFVGMTKGPAEEGKYSICLHDNTFISNHLFVSAGWRQEVSMTVRVEDNVFRLAKEPKPAQGHQPFRGIGERLISGIKEGGNTFEGMRP